MKFRFRLLIIFSCMWNYSLCASSAPLQLQEIIQSVDRHYPLIKAAQQEILRAKADFLSAQGAFDPALNTNYDAEPVGGYGNSYIDNEFSVPTYYRGMRLFGGYRIGVGDFPIYDNYYETNSGGEARAGIELPLLRGSSIDAQRAALQKTRLEAKIQEQNLALTRIDALRLAGEAYWDWVGAAKRVNIFQQLLTLSTARGQWLTKRYHAGDAPKIDQIENQRIVLQRQSALTHAKMLYYKASFSLSLFYRNQQGEPILPNINQVPTLLPIVAGTLPKKSTSSNLATELLLYNPEIQRIETEKKRSELDLRLAKNNMLPQIDALAYTSKDFGDGNPKLTPTAINLGIKLYLPLFRRQAKGQVAGALNDISALEYQEKYMLDKIKIVLENSQVQLEGIKRQYILASNELILAEQLERAENIKFRLGDSSLFLVNQRELSSFEVRQNQLDLTIDYFKSKLALQSACAFQDKCVSYFIPS